jgi:hypothetical protein
MYPGFEVSGVLVMEGGIKMRTYRTPRGMLECMPQKPDCNDNDPSFIDRKHTFSAKTPRSVCWGTVPVAYLTKKCRRLTQLHVRVELRASGEAELSLL